MKEKTQKQKTKEIHEKENKLFREYKELINQGYSPESPECVELRKEILTLNVDFCLSKAHKKYPDLIKKTGDVWEVASLIYLGLVRAFPRYNPDKNVYFTSFAECDIKHMVSEFYYNDANIKPYDAELIRKYNKAKEEIIKIYGTDDRPMSDYQKVSKMSPTNIMKAQTISNRANRVFISDNEFYDIFGASDYGNPESEVMEELKNETLSNALKKLTPKEKGVISLYFGFSSNKEETYNSISKELGIPIGDVKRTLNQALMKLREDADIREYFSIGKNEEEEKENAEDYDFAVYL